MQGHASMPRAQPQPDAHMLAGTSPAPLDPPGRKGFSLKILICPKSRLGWQLWFLESGMAEGHSKSAKIITVTGQPQPASSMEALIPKVTAGPQ